ncbi:MAG: hypothetical protein GY804_10325 [Alphaproteobacteria bacterium]|nr:hypothetical protein [Alphaproteobacteria bacterium]
MNDAPIEKPEVLSYVDNMEALEKAEQMVAEDSKSEVMPGNLLLSKILGGNSGKC